MATHDSLIPALRARAEALGHKLVTNRLRDFNEADHSGLYILNPQPDDLVIVTAGSAADDEHEIAGRCEKGERATLTIRCVDEGGDFDLPKELAPARDIYLRLVRDAEAMSVDELRETAAKLDTDIAIVGVSEGSSYLFIDMNLTHGGAYAYARKQLGSAPASETTL